ncbi:MAG: ABC transporter substrate-binding protein [Rhodospirillum sp.]|nr:ABC transporter substrate-binding protein [Rhodospirillum sp.]MCF8490559.1 ABC transporter substrate-binding protein [Rhodospirillum sp.]MCF8500605.1 ABC transporter substrate-binding protein [Rhodospirillum sp.]
MKSGFAALAGLVAASICMPAQANDSAKVSAKVSDGVVKIGVLTDMAGPYSDNLGPGAVLAAEMAAEDFGGTVNGAPIEIVSADHQNKADVGASMARRWFDTDGVDVITELGSSAVAAAAQDLARASDKILLITGAGSPALTGEHCSPNGIHWAYDNYALGKLVATALVDQGLKKWFFITADYSFGHSLEESAAKFVDAEGGQVMGTVRHPLGTADFSSFLLQAQASGADVIGLANAGTDMINAMKQASEFGVIQGGQKMVGLLVNLPDIHALGLQSTQGLMLAENAYWKMNPETEAWGKRFMDRFDGRAPSSLQIAVYTAVSHYLESVKATGTDETQAVLADMKAREIDDMTTKGAHIRADGRVIRDMYLMRVKAPEESEGPWDYYTIEAKLPGESVFRPQSEGGCEIGK